MRPIRDALGRVLARDIVSAIDVPAHDNSAMDGYALRGSELLADAPTQLRIVGSGLAGQNFDGEVPAHGCVRITTGAVMPPGLDTVVPQEFTQRRRPGMCSMPPGVRARRRQPAPGRRRPGAWRAGAVGGPGAASGRPGAAGLARPGRGAGAPAPARGLLLHRRRIALDRRAARHRLRLRQQPLHAVGHAAAPGRGRHRPGRGARRTRGTGRGLHAGGGLRRCGHHLGRRQRRRGRPHQADHGRARRGAVLEDRHAARPADGHRAHRPARPRRPSCSACPATRWR